MVVIDETLLETIRQESCCWPDCGAAPVDPHHIHPKGIGGGSRLDIEENVIPLCRWHHNGCHVMGAFTQFICWHLVVTRLFPKYLHWEEPRQVVWDALKPEWRR